MIGRGTASRAITRNATINAAHFKVRTRDGSEARFSNRGNQSQAASPNMKLRIADHMRVRAVNGTARWSENGEVQQIRTLVETEGRQRIVDAVERPCERDKASNAETHDQTGQRGRVEPFRQTGQSPTNEADMRPDQRAKSHQQRDDSSECRPNDHERKEGESADPEVVLRACGKDWIHSKQSLEGSRRKQSYYSSDGERTHHHHGSLREPSEYQRIALLFPGFLFSRQGCIEVSSCCKAAVWIRINGALDDGDERCGEIGSLIPQAASLTFGVCVGQAVERAPGHGIASSDQVVKQHANGVDVGRDGGGAALEDFRRKVERRAPYSAYRRPPHELAGTEVHQDDAPSVRGTHHVLCLHIAVHHACLVDSGQGETHFLPDVRRLAGTQPSVGDEGPKACRPR